MNPVADRSSGALEDYLKTIYSLTERGDGPASTSRLAERLGLSPSSVSGMLRRLAELDLVHHRPYGGIRLTEQGTRTALRVLRRHRLLETYLVAELGYGWDEVHDEAEILEHHVSDLLLSRIDARLGHPRFDPHGDPIPSEDGQMSAVRARRLATLSRGDSGRLVRVDDTDPEMLRHLRDRSIDLGATLELLEQRPFDGPFVVRVGDGGPGTGRDGPHHEIGPALAAAMWIHTG